jgi:DNA-binding NtrC family response regulator
MAGRDDPKVSEASTAARQPPSIAATLRIFTEHAHTEYALPGRDALVVGRGRDVDVHVEHSSVSRRHAVLHLGASTRIEDLGSANGTRIDGRALASGSQEPLPLGAIVELGEVRLVLCNERANAPSPMERVEHLVARVAPSDVNVMLVGETGVGKEVLAEELHRRSKRVAGPFLKLNCAAVPDALLESELFGYERGAFTGADRAKVGLLEAAQGGTFLLDEVAELPAQTQAKLLRVLENREVLPVGAVRPRSLDVRFVAATHRNLDVMVVQGRFRQDLAFRLNGITIAIPPLRERTADIADLARVFAAAACTRAGRAAVAISDHAMALLESYRWPGNVRELRNVVERGVLLCSGDCIEPQHLTFGGPGASVPSPSSATVPAIAPTAPAPIEDDERQRIARALEQCGGNQTEAAKLLGMTRRMLRYRVEKLGLPQPRKSTPER